MNTSMELISNQTDRHAKRWKLSHIAYIPDYAHNATANTPATVGFKDKKLLISAFTAQ